MKIWVLSDLHLESQAAPLLTPPEADVCVVAGDVTHGLVKAMEWLADVIAPHMPVVFVPGNHEFFGSSVAGELAMAALGGRTRGGVWMLSNRAVVMYGVRFVGATLWTAYNLHAVEESVTARDREIAWAMRNAGGLLPDHAAIRDWMPEHARAAHLESRKWLERHLARRFDGPTVVVTHHAPSPLSIPPHFEGHPTTPAYATDLKGLIWRRRPELWIHGHIHSSAYYEVGSTKILCNPRGYGTENPEFDPALVVEVRR